MNLRSKWSEDNKEHLNMGGKYTKTTLFLLPILDVYYKDFLYANKQFLINCHLDLEMSELIVILNNEDSEFEPLTALIYRLTNDSLFSESYTDNEDKEIILTFDLTKGWLSDLNKFKKGAYSKFSDVLKRKLVKYYGEGSSTDHKSTIYDSIYPTDEKKKLLISFLGVDVPVSELTEVMDKPNLEIEQYKNLKQLQEIYGVKQ